MKMKMEIVVIIRWRWMKWKWGSFDIHRGFVVFCYHSTFPFSVAIYSIIDPHLNHRIPIPFWKEEIVVQFHSNSIVPSLEMEPYLITICAYNTSSFVRYLPPYFALQIVRNVLIVLSNLFWFYPHSIPGSIPFHSPYWMPFEDTQCLIWLFHHLFNVCSISIMLHPLLCIALMTYHVTYTFLDEITFIHSYDMVLSLPLPLLTTLRKGWFELELTDWLATVRIQWPFSHFIFVSQWLIFTE